MSEQLADREPLALALDASIEARAHRTHCPICRPRWAAGGELCALGSRLQADAERAWRAYDRAPRPLTLPN